MKAKLCLGTMSDGLQKDKCIIPLATLILSLMAYLPVLLWSNISLTRSRDFVTTLINNCHTSTVKEYSLDWLSSLKQ